MNSALDALRARLREMRAREDARRAALPPEERAALDAECEASRLAWEAQERRKREHPFFGDFTIESRARGWDMPGAWLVYEHPAPGVIDVSHHFSMLLCDDLEAPPALLDATAGLASVLRTLADVGVVLRPAQASGPQYPEWGKSLRFARTVARIAEEAPARDDEDPDDPEFAPILAPATLEEVAQVAARLAQARASAEP